MELQTYYDSILLMMQQQIDDLTARLRIYLGYFLCFSPISHDEFFTFSGGNSIVHER